MWHLTDKVRLKPGGPMRAWYSAVSTQLLSSQMINDSSAHHSDAVFRFKSSPPWPPVISCGQKQKHNKRGRPERLLCLMHAMLSSVYCQKPAISVLSAFPSKRRAVTGEEQEGRFTDANCSGMYKHLRSSLSVFPSNRKRRPHGGKLTDVVKPKKIKLIRLMVVRQPDWHFFTRLVLTSCTSNTIFPHDREVNLIPRGQYRATRRPLK